MIDLLDLVRSIAAAAERSAENKNYPVPCGQSSPLLDSVRQACVERGYTAGGLSVPGVTGEPELAGSFQARVQPWMMACFGAAIAADGAERNHRFLEESLELVQACGCTASEAHQLVDYVYGRPVGERAQEVGGVMVTLAALCLAQGLDMHAAGETELARIWTKVEAIRAKQAAKPKHSPLPAAAAPQVAADERSAAVHPADGTISPFTVINLGHGQVKVGDAVHDGRLPALWFGKDGLGMGAVEEMNRAAAEGETLAVVTFSNVEGLDVLAEVVQRIRSIAFPAAPAAQGDTVTLTRDELVNHRNQAFEQGVCEGKDQAAQGGAKDVTTIATKIVLDVAELDRDSPTDQPDMMLVTGDELRTIAIAAITTKETS